MPAIEIKSLSKVFSGLFSRKGFEALRDVNLEVDEGSIFGLIGPNGAGKTTTIKSILNLVNPTSGTISIFGSDSREKRVRACIGYLPEISKLPVYLTGRQFVNVFSSLLGFSKKDSAGRFERLIEKTDLANVIDKKISEYSKGMKKKLGFIHAVLHEPAILMLDEPIEGLDTVGKNLIIDILHEYKKAGKTVFINSHYLTEVEKVCDCVAIIKRGRIVMQLPVGNNDLAKRGYTIGISRKNTKDLEVFAKTFPLCYEDNESILLESSDEALLNKLISELSNSGVLINRIEKTGDSLEDIYLSAIKD